MIHYNKCWVKTHKILTQLWNLHYLYFEISQKLFEIATWNLVRLPFILLTLSSLSRIKICKSWMEWEGFLLMQSGFLGSDHFGLKSELGYSLVISWVVARYFISNLYQVNVLAIIVDLHRSWSWICLHSMLYEHAHCHIWVCNHSRRSDVILQVTKLNKWRQCTFEKLWFHLWRQAFLFRWTLHSTRPLYKFFFFSVGKHIWIDWFRPSFSRFINGSHPR